MITPVISFRHPPRHSERARAPNWRGAQRAIGKLAFGAVLAIGLLSVSANLSVAIGQSVREPEHVTFESVTPLGTLSIPRQAKGGLTPVKVSAELYMPASRSGPVPAMLIMHGSSGLTASGPKAIAWTERLNSWGIATLVVDSFGSRGIKETATNQQSLSAFANVADAFKGLEALSKDPRIDRNRIGVMGFSRGGNVALYTTFESFRRVLVPSDLRFAVHIPLYPSCASQYTDAAIDRSPVLHLHGEADNQTPIEQCREYLKWFERMGSEVRLVSYPDAHHGFDHPTDGIFYSRNSQAYIKCDGIYDIPSGKFTRLDHVDNPKQTPEEANKYWASCFSLGSNSGRNVAAQMDAYEQVRRFLGQHFRLPI